MKAAMYERTGLAADVIGIVDLPDPEPGPGEVLVRIAASGVNPHDTKKRSGWLGGAVPEGGIVPHSDGAGEVVSCGPGVDTSWIGRRVYVRSAGPTRGTAAEYCAVSTDYVFDLPVGLSFAQGASLGVPAFTAWLCVLGDGGVTGDTVLVQGGSGAVGRVAVEMAAWNGATVIATAGSPERAAIARRAGATHVLDYREADLTGAILDLTQGRGVDRIVEVDLGANMTTDARLLAVHGTLCSYSSTSDRTPVLPYYDFALKGVSLHFIQASRMRPADNAAAGRAIGALLAAGRIAPDISATFGIDDCARAHDLMAAGGAGGNIVVTFP